MPIAYVIDDAQAKSAIAAAARAVEHPQGLMAAFGGYFVMSTQRRFETETGPDGVRWPRLSARTANKRLGKGRRGYDHMLRVTARLYQSIAYEAMANSVEWGSNVKYARIHQLGGAIDIPAREGRVRLKSIRRKGGGVRSRFARRGTKGAIERAVQIGAHRIVIPARPYLGVNAVDEAELADIAVDYLRSEVGN